jgi:hypothetical protein
MRNNNPPIFQNSGVSSVPQSETSKAARYLSTFFAIEKWRSNKAEKVIIFLLAA